MKTEQNRAKVLAQFLRAATRDLQRQLLSPDEKKNALDSIVTVAEELETIAAEPGRTSDR